MWWSLQPVILLIAALGSGAQGGLRPFRTYGQRRKLKQLRSPFKFLGISDDHDSLDILNGLFRPLLVHGIRRSEVRWLQYLARLLQ